MRTVVIGAGAAGLWCALHAKGTGPVTVVAPGAAGLTATAWAQGGVAAAIDPNDSPSLHAADTLAAGGGLCDPRAVDVLVHEAPLAVEELRGLGMRFDEGDLPGLEGGHSARRVLHANGDASGMALHRFLTARVAADAGIERVDGRVARLVVREGRAAGVVLDDGRVIEADRTVLATGGACGIYGRRTGPQTSIGDGLALAWEAGAALADLEFVQFHPTALDLPGRPARLFTEALRGEGAILVDAAGDRFMDRFHPLGELAPRDILARAVVRMREETGAPVYLDARAVRDVARRFPTAAGQCREVGLDITRDLVPVAPAAHYFIGGVLTDLWGRTTLPGLFAAGEAAATGVHGANRLASNSLAEALVFGARAARADDDGGPTSGSSGRIADGLALGALPLDEIRLSADRVLGVCRTAGEIGAFLDRLRSSEAADGSRVATLVASLVAASALGREESRGAHFRGDFPDERPEWRSRHAADMWGWWFVSVRSEAEPEVDRGRSGRR